MMMMLGVKIIIKTIIVMHLVKQTMKTPRNTTNAGVKATSFTFTLWRGYPSPATVSAFVACYRTLFCKNNQN